MIDTMIDMITDMERNTMRTSVAAAALLMVVVAAPFASAQTMGVGPPDVVVMPPPSPVDNARNIAMMNGVVDIRKIDFYDDYWHVEGRDQSGHSVSMTIDPRTNTIAHLERYD